MVAWWLLLASRAQPVEPGAWFEYGLTREVTGTGREYLGYSDRLVATGRYELPTHGAARGAYRWTWSASDGKREAGSEDRSVTWDPGTRRYTGDRTDLDEYDGKPTADLAIWFWIPPDTPAGATVQLLEHPFLVVSRDARFRDAGVDRPAIELAAEGVAERHDDYGDFSYTWTERFLFDAATGLVLADRYEERDTALDGSGSSFTWVETLTVTRASFDPALVGVAPEPDRVEVSEDTTAGQRLFSCAVTGLFGLFAVLGVGVTWLRARPIPTEPVTDPEALAGQGAEFTPLFAPFLADLARKAALLGSPALVTRVDGRLTGFGCRDPESGLGTVFGADARTVASLASALKANELFVEQPAFAGGRPVEAFAVLARGAEPRPTWDPAVVRRGRLQDVAEISALSQEIYGVPCVRWAQAQLDAGDLLYVAEVDGRFAGFGFATLAGPHGRLHGLTVHPDFRNRGLGTELVRARVRVLLDLGAERILTEVAKSNVGSMHVATGLGFTPVGAVFAVPSTAKRLWFRR